MITLTQTEMTVNDWIKTKDCPIQRDTVRHSKLALQNNLSSFSETHRSVSAAKVKGEDIYKLDGHTRSYLWSLGKLQIPNENLKVDLYIVDTIEEVKSLYKQFDSKYSVETSSDKLFGAFKSFGLIPESHLLISGGINSAIATLNKTSLSRLDIYQNIELYIEPLRLIDKRMYTSRGFPRGIISGLIATVMMNGEDSLYFWDRYASNEGLKNGKNRDSVQALTEVVDQYRAGGKTSSNAHFINDLFGKSIWCFNQAQDYFFSSYVRVYDTEKYLKLLSDKYHK